MRHVLNPAMIAAMGETRRWHTRPVHRDQTIAEHSHQVALLALWLDPDLDSAEVLQVMLWGLLHDAHEPEYGDMPYPAKAALLRQGIDVDTRCQDLFWGGEAKNPGRMLDQRLLDLVDVADALEAAIFARHHLPSIAGIVQRQAEVQVRLRLSGRLVPFRRALQALEVPE